MILNLLVVKVSVIIRTYNESKYLEELLEGVRKQDDFGDSEIIIVDSGSTDRTLDIAKQFSCVIVHIKKSDFTFGRSLNMGCQVATGDILIIVSGHCIPVDYGWIKQLIRPITEEKSVYTYGKQVGNNTSKFSEKQHFNRTYSEDCKDPQEGFFCNNANSALKKTIWEKYKFDEELTGLEDMELSKRLVADGYNLSYISTAAVYHLHNESWSQIRKRYEREALALQNIMPELQLNFLHACNFSLKSILCDIKQALLSREKISIYPQILMYRCMQYWGSYKGNHLHRRLSRKKLEQYFYPE